MQLRELNLNHEFNFIVSYVHYNSKNYPEKIKKYKVPD